MHTHPTPTFMPTHPFTPPTPMDTGPLLGDYGREGRGVCGGSG